jgi:hypothetical protein
MRRRQLLPQPDDWTYDERRRQIETKRDAEKIMAIFDLAPPHVRERTRLNPEGIDLVWWWQTQTEWKIDQGKIIRRV